MVLSDKFFIVLSFCFCLLGAAVFYHSEGGQNYSEEAIAHLVKTKNNIQIRRDQELAWKNATEGQGVNTGDYILTKESSFVTLSFKGSSAILNLSPNSLVKIEKSQNQINLLAESGFFDLDISSVEGASGLLLAGQKIKATTKGGKAKVRFFKSTGNSRPTLQVMEGKIEVSNELGQNVNVDSGEEVEMKALTKKRISIELKTPAHMINVLPGKQSSFSWSAKNVEFSYFEISSDINFIKKIFTDKLSKEKLQLKLKKPGSYYWRVGDGKGSFSFPRQIQVNAPVAPSLISPSQNEKIKFSSKSNKVKFEWQSQYEYDTEFEIVHIPSSKKTSNVFDKKEVFLKIKNPGEYKWRARTKYPFARWSKYKFFKLSFEAGAILALEPKFNHKRHIGFDKKDSLISFQWQSEIGGKFLLEFSPDPNMKKIVYKRRSDKTDLSVYPFKAGHYYWRVSSMKYKGVASKPRKILFSRDVGEFLNPQDKTILPILNPKNQIEFFFGMWAPRMLLEISEYEDFHSHLYKIKIREPRKKVALKIGKYFAKLSPLPGMDKRIWKERVIAFEVKGPDKLEAPVLPRYLQAILTNPEDVSRGKKEVFFVTWPEVQRAIRYEVRLRNPITKKTSRHLASKPFLNLVGNYVESRVMEIIAIDNFGQRTPSANKGKLLFPVAPLTKFPKFLQSPENWDYTNLENIINQKRKNIFKDGLD